MKMASPAAAILTDGHNTELGVQAVGLAKSWKDADKEVNDRSGCNCQWVAVGGASCNHS